MSTSELTGTPGHDPLLKTKTPPYPPSLAPPPSQHHHQSMVPKMGSMKYAPLLVFQVILLVLYFIFATYKGSNDSDIRGFEDTHVMIFIGFGFLMTFLKKYCYSALGLNWLLAALAVQWALLCQAFFSMENNTIYVTKKAILEADIMSATVLITFGALLGVASATQLLIITIVEVAVGCFNFYLIEHVFKASDIGGSIGIHTFGAYFGLGVSLAYRNKRIENPGEDNLNAPNYGSDITAMIGSIFLWIYWPSFNSALASTDAEYQRAVVNTYLSLAAATVVTFVISSMVSKHHGAFDMVHVQNSTLAGGVAVGAVANMHIGPGAAVAIGMGAGLISVLGYRFLTPMLEKIGILDTCGVNNLHGMPGVYSGLLSVLFAALATKETYGLEYESVFEGFEHDKRTPSEQALYQFIALAATLAVALISGAITGFITKMKVFKPLKETERYNDELNWELP